MSEKCVSCGNDTGISVDKHVDFRYYYVEGAGQLCKDCWHATYDEKNKNASIAQSVEHLTLNQ